MALDDVAAGERIVEPGREARRPRQAQRFGADPSVRASPEAVAEDDRRHPSGRRRHRMAVEQHGATEAADQRVELLGQEPVVGPVGLVEALLELVRADRAAPQDSHGLWVRPGTMPRPPRARALIRARPPPSITDGSTSSSARLQSIAARGARAMTAPLPRWIARHASRSTSGSSSPSQGRAAARGHGNQPIGIVAARMRHGQAGPAARRAADGRSGRGGE